MPHANSHSDTTTVLSEGRNVTKARVLEVDWRGLKAVAKTYAHRPAPVRRGLGPLLLAREERALRRLESLDGVPRCLERPEPGVLILSRLAGRTLRDLLRAGEQPPSGFFTRLDTMLDLMHRAGVAQGDIGIGDVLVRPDGSPGLLDFSVSVVRGQGLIGRLLFDFAVAQDQRRFERLRRRFGPPTEAQESPRRGTVFGRLRLAMVAVLLGVWALSGRPTPADVLIGLPAVCAGGAVRVWAAGHLLKTRQLATSGPYAYCRHPLYLGRLLIFAGLAVMARLPWNAHLLVLAGGLGIFFLYYLPRKERVEGERLERAHGDAYRRYRDAVPALIPGRRWADAQAGEGWQLARFVRNRELLMLILESSLVALMAWRAFA